MVWPVFVCPSLCTAVTCSDQYLVWDLLASLGFDVHLGKAEMPQTECIFFEAVKISCAGYHFAASYCVLLLIFKVGTCVPF